MSLQALLSRQSSDKKRIAYLAEATAELTGLELFPQYLTLLFEIDALFLNDDRHLNNIAVLESGGKYDYCPIFDNGAGLLSNIDVYKRQHHSTIQRPTISAIMGSICKRRKCISREGTVSYTHLCPLVCFRAPGLPPRGTLSASDIPTPPRLYICAAARDATIFSLFFPRAFSTSHSCLWRGSDAYGWPLPKYPGAARFHGGSAAAHSLSLIHISFAVPLPQRSIFCS